MPAFFGLWPMAWRRLQARWKLLLPLFLGSVLAVALLSSTIIYGDAVRQLGLNFAFSQERHKDLDIDLLSYYNPTEVSSFKTIANEMEVAISRNVDWFVEGSTQGMQSSTFFVNDVARGPEALSRSTETIQGLMSSQKDPRLRSKFLFRTQLDAHVTLIAGARPQAVSVELDTSGRPTSWPEMPGLVLEETAIKHDLGVGDRLMVVPYWEESLPYGVARISGIIRAKNPQDRYWQTRLSEQTARARDQNFIPLYISEDSFLLGLGRLFPDMLSDYSWTLHVDPQKIDVRNVPLARFGFERMESQLRSRLRTFLITTSLDTVLSDFGTRDLFGRIPLLIMIVMIIAIIFYFLCMIANVVVARDFGEIALLGSRGAGEGQMLGLYLWEAIAIVLTALVVGPFLSLVATSALGYTPGFQDLTGGSPLPVTLTTPAILLALGGGGIAFFALMLPTLMAFRRNPLQHKAGSTRPNTTSVVNRYYLDIFVGILAAVLFWELTQRGSVVTTSLLGETNVDKALLGAPALFLLAVALLFLRLFPWLTRWLSWVTSFWGKAWLALSMWQLARNPLQYTGLILLLMLASSVAMFAANFGPTLKHSYTERASYKVGSEFLVPGPGLRANGASVSFSETTGDFPGAESWSFAFRHHASLAQRLFDSGRFDVLAIDPESFEDVAWYRDDFSEPSLADIVSVLDSDTPSGLHGRILPPGTTKIGVWVLPTNPSGRLLLRARIVDVNGRYEDFTMGILSRSEWTYKETDITLADDDETGRRIQRYRMLALEPPFRLISLTVQQRSGSDLAPGAIYLDDLQAGFSSARAPVIVETFDDFVGTVIQDTPRAFADTLDASDSITLEGRGKAGVFIWGGGSAFSSRGFSFGNAQERDLPLSAIASRSFMEKEDIAIGDQLLISISGHRTLVKVTETVDFFPTLNPYENGFLVMNMPALLEHMNTVAVGLEHYPSETWVGGPSEGNSRELLAQTFRGDDRRKSLDRQVVLENMEADPLVAAGWDGILTMAFIAVIFVTLVGFSVFAFVQAQTRRVEFALLRSVGLSQGGLIGLVLFEQAVVIVLGLALGSWLGVQLTSILMPFLGLNQFGTQLLPPFVVQIDWAVILTTYAIMAAVFLASTVGLITFFSRMAIQRALRFGEF
ncbi:ABC transporter permease [Dehalococcoidia bacterium]|nr:ABC transporter permease [Dehalococcoidia bacterium]